MINRFKLIAAALGFVVAGGAVGDASAAVVKTVTRTATHTKIVKTVAHRSHRLHFGARTIKIVRVAHRVPGRVVAVAPIRPVLARTIGPRHALASRVVVAKRYVVSKRIVAHRFVAHRFVAKTVVRISRHPLFQRHAMLHRAGGKVVVR